MNVNAYFSVHSGSCGVIKNTTDANSQFIQCLVKLCKGVITDCVVMAYCMC